MRATIIDGNGIADEVREGVAAEAAALSEAGVRPGLGVILVGADPASQVYVRMKTRACEEAGIFTRDVRPPMEISQEDLLAEIDAMNEDPQIHGILVQLPLPDHLDDQAAMERIRPSKDVDGFHPMSVGRVCAGDRAAFRPATPAGVQEMLRHIDVDPAGKHVVVLGRSNIVGLPMANILLQKEPFANATVTVAHSRTRDLGAITRQAEILIVAVGRPEMIRGDMVREGAVVIDVGVNRVEDDTRERGYRLVGDVAFDEVAEVADWISPVPGGVGPMTIAMLLRNTVTAARRAAQEAHAAAV